MISKLIPLLVIAPFSMVFSQNTPDPASLKWEEITPPFDEEIDGNFLRGRLDGKVRQTKSSTSMGDYGGQVHTAWFDESGTLTKFIYESVSLEYDSEDPDKVFRIALEREFSFKNGNFAKASESRAKGENGKPQKVLAAEIPIEPHAQNVKRLVDAATEMITAKAPRLVVVSEDLDRAQNRILDEPISSNLEDWAPVKIPFARHAQDLESAPEIAALNLLMKFGFVEEGGEAQAVYFDILKSKPKHSASVAVTIDNPGDDEIAAIRYLIEIGNNLETWQLMGIGRQIKRWEDRGGKGWEKR